MMDVRKVVEDEIGVNAKLKSYNLRIYHESIFYHLDLEYSYVLFFQKNFRLIL